ncbi:hypothetical protein ACPCHT_07740 [Nucisporomicrobium flavum]|uniref:hypothetical protein n=1 Tax=Nucisporomicrobium flavum TaxID=2785915 RepID=UPI003C2B7503
MTAEPAATTRPRPGRSLWMHLLAAGVFGLLAWSGVAALGESATGPGVASLIAGVAGGAGSLVIAGSMWRAAARGGGGRRSRPQLIARTAMAMAAVGAGVAGVLLAPDGMDHGFVIGVAVIHAVLLALFAVLCGDAAAAAPGHRAGGVPESC